MSSAEYFTVLDANAATMNKSFAKSDSDPAPVFRASDGKAMQWPADPTQAGIEAVVVTYSARKHIDHWLFRMNGRAPDAMQLECVRLDLCKALAALPGGQVYFPHIGEPRVTQPVAKIEGGKATLFNPTRSPNGDVM